MIYTVTTLDRSTGDVKTQSIGNWVTISEFGKSVGIGPRQIRHILHHAGLLRKEGQHGRYRLSDHAVQAGFGKRHEKSVSGYPFDVLSPSAQSLLLTNWQWLLSDFEQHTDEDDEVHQASKALDEYQQQRMTKLDRTGIIWWLRDHFKYLTQKQIGTVAGVSQQYVAKCLKRAAPSHPKSKDGKEEVVNVGNIRVRYDGNSEASFSMSPAQ
jgi:hypothetical protein